MRAVVLAVLIILLLGGVLAFECHGCSSNVSSEIIPDLRYKGEAAIPAFNPVESMLGTVDNLISRR